MALSNSQQALLALLRVGLWEDAVKVNGFIQNDFDSVQLKIVSKGQEDGLIVDYLPLAVNYNEILQLAQVQSVVGLVAVGVGNGVSLTEKLKLLGNCQIIEQRNVAMNLFIEDLTSWLKQAGIMALLVKGQGIAQCYVRPQWRGAGDVDLFFLADYKNAVDLLSFIASEVEKENPLNLHQAMTIDSWTVELHGTMRGLLKRRLDKVVDEVQDDTFTNNRVRVWHNGGVDVLLPAPDNDVIFVFSHLLQHFFKETVSLRQICDWCRLLWTYKDEIDRALLENRLRRMKVMSEWRAFAALAIDYLGMPLEAMPLYSPSRYWSRKGKRLLEKILNENNGNAVVFHLLSDYMNRKANSFLQYTKAGMHHHAIFPLDTVVVWINMIIVGVRVVLLNEKTEKCHLEN